LEGEDSLSEPVPVLQFVNQFAIGGAEGQFVARVRALPDRFRPMVACVRKEGPNLRAIEEIGLQVEVFGLAGSLARANTGRQVMRLAAFLVQNGIKLVHSNDFYTNVLAVPAARLARAKVIASRFDLAHWYSPRSHVVEALACRAADAVYANARAVRDMCVNEEAVVPDRVVVVHNGIDLEAFDRARAAPLQAPVPGLELGADGKSRRPAIVLVGNLYPVKGHLDLVEAVEEIRRRIPDVLVLCAGEGVMRPTLEQQIRARGLKETMVLLGHRLDVPALLARAHVACLPSHAEGLSNAVIEAMAASLPVVATSVGGNVELVEEAVTGHLVPAHRPAFLADRLSALLAAPDRARKLGSRGRARVEADLTLGAMANKTGDLYDAVLAGQAPAERLPLAA
jgi:glycosyltransferase involved in cell wall biosynthesis